MTAPESGTSISELAERLVSRWVLLVAFGVGGAILGLAYSAAHPPQYEARAVLGVSITYAVTESLELVVEDRALSRVSGLIQANDVLSGVLDRLSDSVRETHGWHTPADLRKSVRLDPRLAQWELVTISEDPVLAATVSRLWAEEAIRALDEATAHAWRAAAIIGQKMDLKCTSSRDGQAAVPGAQWNCVVEPPLTDPALIEAGLVNEIALSRGVVPDLTYELLQDATPPRDPVLWNRALLVLAGAIIGLLLGVGTALALQPRRGTVKAE